VLPFILHPCLQINAEKAPYLTDKLKVWMLPTLALIKGEKVIDYVVGFDDMGGKDDFTTGGWQGLVGGGEGGITARTSCVRGCQLNCMVGDDLCTTVTCSCVRRGKAQENTGTLGLKLGSGM
jgi:hypothetical protein